MEREPAKRPQRAWLQIHLLTIVMVTVIAGGLVGMNSRAPRIAETHFAANGAVGAVAVQGPGWPVPSYVEVIKVFPPKVPEDYLIGINSWHKRALVRGSALNAAILLPFLLLAAFLIERLICRRRKPLKSDTI